jgi:hypothetical protein
MMLSRYSGSFLGWVGIRERGGQMKGKRDRGSMGQDAETREHGAWEGRERMTNRGLGEKGGGREGEGGPEMLNTGSDRTDVFHQNVCYVPRGKKEGRKKGKEGVPRKKGRRDGRKKDRKECEERKE